jgi:hypothetical protein
VELQPRRPPGRADRKAAVYASEIGRLRSVGYTYDAIREALADVGIELSTSALRREVRRLCNPPICALSAPQSQAGSRSAVSTAQASSLALQRGRVTPTPSSGHEIAEAFFEAHPSNPLLSTKEIP